METVQVPYQVRVAIQSAPPVVVKPIERPKLPDMLTNTELQTMPPEAVELLFGYILANERDAASKVFLELGCGEGVVLERAADAGYIAIGVELHKQRAAETRKRLAGKATVLTADARDVGLASADVIVFWFYPQLIAELEFPGSATVVSYHFELDGAYKVTSSDGKHVFYVRPGRS